MKTFIVDSFTNEAFKGNPAGVCLVEEEITPRQMLLIAQELGFSETAFIRKIESENIYSIRFFSPKMEISLCGHATMAASKVLFASSDHRQLHFINVEGLDLRVQKMEDEIAMEFPLYDTVRTQVPDSLWRALGVEQVLAVEYNQETRIVLLEIDDTDILKKLNPDFRALEEAHTGINGVVVTARSHADDFDFHSRYFWPWSGTNEDPVTGGTHTFLTSYWSKKLNKNKMRAFQSSQRTGFMNVEIIDLSKVRIAGQAVILFEGNLNV